MILQSNNMSGCVGEMEGPSSFVIRRKLGREVRHGPAWLPFPARAHMRPCHFRRILPWGCQLRLCWSGSS